MKGPTLHLTLIAALTLLSIPHAFAQDAVPTKDDVARAHGKKGFSPYAGRSYPTQVLWGDTHTHTAISVDAGTMNRLGQEEAYRFARGEEVTSTGGLRAKLSRPLDWLVISDHAEMYGLMPQLLKGDPDILATQEGKRWYNDLKSGDIEKIFATAMEIVASLQKPDPPFKSDALVRDAWRAYTALADRYNEPGRFSAIIGFEYTTRGGFNMHRNVLFRGDASVANQMVPFSQFDSQNPEDLWKALAKFEDETGADVLAIPHNGNLSNGLMFSVETNAGEPLTRELANLRARLEPLIEATQIKGDGEAHPFLSPDDEFADYETWDAANLDGTEVKKKEMLQYEYARSALKTGLTLEKTLGVNPFKFGMIGSTDSHTSLAAVEEDNFFGKHSRSGARATPLGACRDQFSTGSGFDHLGVATGRLRLRSGLGDRKHPRGHFRRNGTQRGLRHDGLTHDGSILRWLGVRGGRRSVPHTRWRWLCQRSPDGR